MSPTLWRSSLRNLLRHPWQAALSVLGIALGVAVVVAVDLATGSASRAFTLSTEAVTGRATHEVVGGPQGVPDSVYRRLRVDLGIRPIAPVVEGYARAPAYPGRPFRVLGLDPFAEGPFRAYTAQLGRGARVAELLTRPGAVLLSAGTARELGLRAGDTLVVHAGGRAHPLVLAGVLDPSDEASRRALEGLLLADIATAQEAVGTPGHLSRIDVLAPAGVAGEALLARIRGALPPGASLEATSARTAAVAGMTRAFELNLRALSLLALVFGMFLIYNTMTFSVVQRRPLLGTLRAVGVTRREVFTLVLGEALLIGLAGTAVGLLLGVALGGGLVRLVTRTINDLYFVVSVRGVSLSALSLAKGVLLGLGATLLAAAAPALEATSAPPRAVLSRSLLEGRARRAAPRAGVAGAGLLLLGGGLLAVPSRSLLLSLSALFVLILGAALLVPLATLALMHAFRPVAGRLFGVPGRMAAAGVSATLSRTAPAVAALSVAISVGVAVGVMIGSFRGTVVRWLESTLQADVYVSVPGFSSTHSDVPMDAALARRLAATPGVAAVTTNRNVTVPSPLGDVRLVAVQAPPGAHRPFRFKEGEPAEVWARFDRGEVVVSEPFAYRHGLRAGSTVPLRTDRGERAFRVAGVYYDYASEQGTVFMDRHAYDAVFDDQAISAVALTAAPGVDADTLVRRLRARAGTGQELWIRSNRGLREATLVVFDRTFAITAVLRVLALAVAFVGVLSALMALQLERARELGVLRATGLTRGQLWGLVSGQTALMGLAAGLLAIPVGTMLAAVMILVVNKRSFGWTLEMSLPPAMLLQGVAVAVGAALLAGLYPALRMARTPPAVALREE
ncbi:MAG TPA: ABC transporter permease [Longimicrobiales bacterium]|nr:ABC transporter permease [Longimicrobiales bacterium]